MKSTPHVLCSLTLILSLGSLAATAATLPNANPEDAGMSAQRLDRVDALIDRYIADQQITGAVTMVARHGEIVHLESQGWMDRENEEPMRRDAIFRMASMSKPVTGVAILMLMEEGKVRLSDPVSRFIPEFTNTQVAVIDESRPTPRGQLPNYYTMPAEREITVRDLLTHTSGLGSGQVYGISSSISPRDGSLNLATYVPTLGRTPLEFQPGSQWSYSLLAGIETLGRIVEVASGMTFDQFLQERLFAPLGMEDTAFVVPAEKQSRLVMRYERTDEGQLERAEGNPSWLDTTTLFSGGGGLYSTADDYIRFAQMLANGGELDGARILSPRTVELMASNHVKDLYGPDAGRPEGLGFGLTVDVVLDPVLADTRRGPGSFAWGGAFGTYFWVDPHNDLVGLLMIQTPVDGLRNDFVNAVVQAIIE